MGNYANWDDVVARYPKSASVADSDEMQDSFIEGVEALMNSCLVKVFDTPISNEPPLLKDICVDLVYCKIAFNRDQGVPKLKEDTLMLLDKICSGELLLTDSAGDAIAQTGEAVFSTSENYHSTFSELDTLEQFTDPELLEDLASERS